VCFRCPFKPLAASVSVCLWRASVCVCGERQCVFVAFSASGSEWFVFLFLFVFVPFCSARAELIFHKKKICRLFLPSCAHNQCDHPEPGLFYYNSCHNSLSFLLMHSTFDFQDILLIVSCRGSLPQCICSCRGSRTGFNLAARGNLQ
jgi:hypothetical protein